ncbi:MAG: class I SAM-dependent methyltransferase [Candidatus Roizmanbacteria bacterium]|nr:class I SAM-dependent methyltransferase [Candidatus Roizmanbacteria bacterium]
MIQKIKTLCYVCGSTDIQPLFFGKDRLHKVDATLFQIYQCKKCGLVFLFPQLTGAELEKYYPETYGPYHTESVILKYGALSRMFKKMLSPTSSKNNETSLDTSTARLLDFGCGGGAYLERIKKEHPHWELFGFDTSEHAATFAREKGFAINTGTAEIALAQFTGEFDYIHLGHVVEHLPDPRATLSFLRTLLKPNGELSLSTPNVDSLAAKLCKSYWFALDTPRHLFLFSPATLSRLLREVGFTVRDIQCTRDMGVEIRSINYLFERTDMRIPFILWHIARALLSPVGILLATLKKSSVMSITAHMQ